MSTRRRFTEEFKPKVALEAPRADKMIQEIATRHKVHPNRPCRPLLRIIQAEGAFGLGRPEHPSGRMAHPGCDHHLPVEFPSLFAGQCAAGLECVPTALQTVRPLPHGSRPLADQPRARVFRTEVDGQRQVQISLQRMSRLWEPPEPVRHELVKLWPYVA